MFYDINVDEYFNKIFEFSNNEKWVLPKKAYHMPSWSIEELQQMKFALNSIKGQLSKFSITTWSDHTKRTDPSTQIKYNIGAKIKIELLTQAWCKFYECLNAFDIIPEMCVNSKKIRSLHLCEAPGAFVSALNYHMYIKHRHVQWEWNANTLNPYYEGNNTSEMILDDSLIQQTNSLWEFGQDQTGDIRKFHNYEYLIKKFEKIDLVTADGSIDCMNNPGEQEHSVHRLHYCEIMIALKVLRKGGNFVLKLFTMYEHETVCLMYLLNCCFKKVCVFKPCSSKSGNSEVYVLCFRYRDIYELNHVWDSLLLNYKTPKEEAIFNVLEMNTEFLQQIKNCAKYFMDLQCNRINLNIELFKENEYSDVWNYLKIVQDNVAKMFLIKYPIFQIPKELRLMKRMIKKRKITHQDTELTVTSTHSQLDDDNLIRTSIGPAVSIVHSSCFGPVLHKLSCTELNSLSQGLPSTCVFINSSCFENDIPQFVLHRRFFQIVIDRLLCRSDIVICGIPLLTRFLVGIIYIMSLCFESFVVHKGGAIVFNNYNEFRFHIVRKHFEKIASLYDMLEFPEDILEVVSLDMLRKGYFFKAICKYNNEIHSVS